MIWVAVMFKLTLLLVAMFWRSDLPNPKPYALRPTPYALSPMPYALSPTPYALSP